MTNWLKLLLMLKSLSNHPIAQSIMVAYGKSIDGDLVSDYEEIPGHGMKVSVKGKEILVGNTKLMALQNIEVNNPDTLGTIVHVGIDHKYAGYIVVSDEVKTDAAEAIKALKSLGIHKIAMLTGDTKVVGEKIGKLLGIDEVYSELLPADKVDQLEKLSETKSKKGKGYICW